MLIQFFFTAEIAREVVAVYILSGFNDLKRIVVKVRGNQSTVRIRSNIANDQCRKNHRHDGNRDSPKRLVGHPFLLHP